MYATEVIYIAASSYAHLAYLRRELYRSLRKRTQRWPGNPLLFHQGTAGGWRNRGIACMLAAESVGGDWRDARDLAVALEIGHKASIIRDDIADGASPGPSP